MPRFMCQYLALTLFGPLCRATCLFLFFFLFQRVVRRRFGQRMEHRNSLQPYTTPVTPKATLACVDYTCDNDRFVVEPVIVSGDIAPDYMYYLRFVWQTRSVVERPQFKSAALDFRTGIYSYSFVVVLARIFNHSLKAARGSTCFTVQANQRHTVECPVLN